MAASSSMGRASGFLQGPPHLQENIHFENGVSRPRWELSFNRELVSRSPERPALGCKQNPKKTFMTPLKALKDGKQISKALRVPIHSQKLPNTTPGKLRQRAVEENMRSIFKVVTEGTLAI
jgi:hypothetical protein